MLFRLNKHYWRRGNFISCRYSIRPFSSSSRERWWYLKFRFNHQKTFTSVNREREDLSIDTRKTQSLPLPFDLFNLAEKLFFSPLRTCYPCRYTNFSPLPTAEPIMEMKLKGEMVIFLFLLRWSGLKYETEYIHRNSAECVRLRSNYHNDGDVASLARQLDPRRIRHEAAHEAFQFRLRLRLRWCAAECENKVSDFELIKSFSSSSFHSTCWYSAFNLFSLKLLFSW